MTCEQLQGTAPGPLAGLVVADLSRVLAGPYAGMMLGDMGATVIKVEHPAGDETRSFRPPVRDGEATYYLSANRNKYGIALDFTRHGDLETVGRIIDQADVMIENFRPGSLERFGLDYRTTAARRPDLVYASITGFGTGAGARLPGYDLCAQALSGLMSVQGAADGPVRRAGFAVFDVFAGLYTTVGILGALADRARTGLGQHVEVDLMSAAFASMSYLTMSYLGAGTVPRRMGNEHPNLYPYAPFPTSDRPMVIAVGNDRQFRALCECLGAGSLASDPRFATNDLRSRNRHELRPLLETVLTGKPADRWFAELTRVGVPCAPINDLAQGVEFARSVGLDPLEQVGQDGEPTVRHPVGYSRTPVSYRVAPPQINQHDVEIRRWLAADTRRRW